MSKILISNGILVTLGKNLRVIKDGAVLIENNLIGDYGKSAALKKKYKDVRKIDAKNKIIMPGFINTHMHLYSTFARGLSKVEPAANFIEILKKLWWKLDKKLNMDDIYYSSLVPLVECIRNGTTTIIDHHASPFSITGSLDKIGKCTKKAGVRACLCYEVSDRDGCKVADEGIEENINFIKKTLKNKDSMLTGLFGLHASFTVSGKTLRKCVAAAEPLNTGFHVHTAEDLSDRKYALKKYKKGVIERWRKEGILGSKTILAHCIYITEKEMGLMAKTGTNAVHNPQSNMNNAVGVADVIKMLEKGVLLGLGTDGMTSRMQEEARTAYLLQRIAKSSPLVAFMEAPQMLLVNNAKIANKIFPVKTGEIVKGAAADIILIDYIPPTPINSNNFLGHFLFGIYGAPVDTTIVNGKILMQNKKIKTLNEEVITEKSRKFAEKLWRRF